MTETTYYASGPLPGDLRRLAMQEPLPIVRREPYTFEGAYSGCYAVPAMAMDPRHVYIVNGILRVWPFRNALELGSYNGASATAFIDAINRGSPMTATFCDVEITESLRSVVGNCAKPDRVRLTREPSWAVLESPEDFDFVMVDANHDLASVCQEIARLILRRPLCVMAHDTNATNAGYPHAEGAGFLARVFETFPGYHCLRDDKQRDGEETDRGLFFATTSIDLHRVASEVFEKFTQENR